MILRSPYRCVLYATLPSHPLEDAVHTRIELVPQDRQSSILTIRPMHQLIEQIMRIELTSSAWQADALTVVLYLHSFGQDKRIELSYSDWKSDILTIVLILQDKMCPSSQTSTLFTKALDFSRYCCGSSRIRTYSARRQRIYSPSQLSNSGALPLNNGINKTQTQSRSLNVSEYKDSVIFRLYKVNNVKFCNNRIYYYIPL